MIIEKSKWEKCPACKQSHKIALALQERVTKLEAGLSKIENDAEIHYEETGQSVWWCVADEIKALLNKIPENMRYKI